MIGCVTVKHFPAWAVIRARDLPPEQPVAVQEAGHVVAANQTAVRLGLHIGMTAARAASLCPHALLPTRDLTSERHAWEFILGQLLRVTPFLEHQGAVIYLSALKNEVRPHILELGVSAGFSTNRTLAQLASIQAAPGQVLSVEAADTASFLDTFPTRLLLETGCSEELIEQLELLGCDTLGLVQRLTERHLTLAFGSEGQALYQFLGQRSQRPAKLYREPAAIRKRFWIETPCSEPHDLLPVVQELAEKASDALPSLLSGQIRITLSFERRQDLTAGRILPSPTADRHRITRFAHRLALDLFSRLEAPDHPESDTLSGDRIDAVEVVLGSLVPADARQSSFFSEKKRWVKRAVDEVHRRYPESIKRAVVRPGAHFHEDRFGWNRWG